MGGAETLITEYALKINKEKFDIVIVTTSSRTNSINETKLKKEGIRVIFLGDNDIFQNPNNKLKRLINTFNRYKLFINLVNVEKPNIIHTHLRTIPYVFAINNKRKNIKLFYTVHSEVRVLFKKYYLRIMSKYCIHRKGMTPIALHNRMKQEVNTFFNTNTCIVLPNGVDMNRFKNIKNSKTELLDALHINKDAFIIGHIGRFVEVKNHKFLVSLFADFKKKCHCAHLVLVGDGVLKEQVKKQVIDLGIQDRVSFLGQRGDIPELLNIMDVFVFPSFHEGFGNVLIEAQAMGVKCVVSNNVPKDAFVTNLVTPISLNDSIEKWSQAVNNLNPTEKNARDLSKYDINHIIRKLENIYIKSLIR